MSSNKSKQKSRKARKAFVSEERWNFENWAYYIPTYDEFIYQLGELEKSNPGKQLDLLPWDDAFMTQERYRIASRALATLIARDVCVDVKFYTDEQDLPVYSNKISGLLQTNFEHKFYAPGYDFSFMKSPFWTTEMNVISWVAGFYFTK